MMKKIMNKSTNQKHGGAFTLIECMIAIVVLMITMGGVMAFRYYTVACAERAENQIMAARNAYLLSEAWRGQKANVSFDPTRQDFDSDFQIEKMLTPGLLGTFPTGSYSEKLGGTSGLSVLGDYRIRVDGKEFLTRLLYGPVAGVPNLRSIHILVVWSDYRGTRCEYYLPTLSQS
jgi:type II secretory pathway pseudopilin PulG